VAVKLEIVQKYKIPQYLDGLFFRLILSNLLFVPQVRSLGEAALGIMPENPFFSKSSIIDKRIQSSYWIFIINIIFDAFWKQSRLRTWLSFNKAGYGLSPIEKKPV